jgi:hypothetical protein
LLTGQPINPDGYSVSMYSLKHPGNSSSVIPRAMETLIVILCAQ